MRSILSVVIIIVLFSGCASSGRKKTEELHNLVVAQQFDKALALVDSKEFYGEPQSQLLKSLERGLLHFQMGHYYQSLQILDKARELSDQLYTVSISKKVTSAINNENSDNYYGERYERSLLRLYIALDHLNLLYTGKYEAYTSDKTEFPERALTEKEKQFHLTAARATILEWDSLLEKYKTEEAGKSIYKNDLMAKILGAFVHELIATGSDLQIAKQLYVDAKKLLVRGYAIYPSFNSKYKEYTEHFEEFPNLGEEKVKELYIAPTVFYKQLEAFIDHRLEILNKSDSDNVVVLLSEGFIAAKTAKSYDYKLPVMSIAYIDGNGMSPTAFAAMLLSSGVGAPSISFELPEIEKKDYLYTSKLIVTNSDGVEIGQGDSYLIDPNSDLANESFSDKIGGLKAKIGLRVAMKHVAAITTSYIAYKKMLKGGSAGAEFIATAVAIGSYAAANKAIKMSEQADVRYWSLLPHAFKMSSFKLPAGEYSLIVENNYLAGGKSERVKLGSMKVEDKKKNFFTFITQ